MGGNAAESLIKKSLSPHPSNEGKELHYRSISNTELDQVLPLEYGTHTIGDESIVGYLLNELIKANLIDPSYFPKFVLGSTRLAAISKYGAENIEIDDFETDDVIQGALNQKTSFGDLDIDVVMTKPIREVTEFLNKLKPGALAAKTGAGEIHLAVKMDDDSVLQVDLVNVSGGDVSNTKFIQYSSFLDLSHNIKGVFASVLLRAVAAVKQPQNLAHFEDFAKANPETDFAQDWGKILAAGYRPFQARYIVSPEHLKLAVEFEKEGVKTVKKLFFPEFQKDYNDLESLAKFLLGESAKGPELLHATALAEYVKNNFSKQQINSIKERYVDALENKIKKGVDPKSYETGLNSIVKILDTEEEPKNLVKEGRKGIGRFVGSSKLTNKNALEIIYYLIHQSDNVGEERFSIDLLEDPSKIDMVEKMDSNFIAIGLDRRKQFFLESSNSGLVYPSTYKQKFGFSLDFLKSYEALMNNERLQGSLKQIFDSFGAFKMNSELFPMLTHGGSSDGRVVFVGTPYLKEKFGSEGGLAVFNAQLWDSNKNSWYRPKQEVSSEIVSSFKQLSEENNFKNEWKVYSNDDDMLLPGKLDINLYGLGDFFEDKESLNHLNKLVRKAEYKQRLDKIKIELQRQLDGFANHSQSNLGGEDSYMEGIVLRIKKEDGDFFEVKGTSEQFDLKKKKYWNDRVELLNLEKDFNNSLIVDILGLPSAHPARINKILKTFVFSDYVNKETINKKDFIFNLLNSGTILADSNIEVSTIRKKLSDLIQDTELELQEILINVKKQEHEKTLDKDSIRKTYEIYNSVVQLIKKYGQTLQMESDEDFIIEFVYLALEKRISKTINFENSTSYEPDEGNFPKVIVIPGRFQPFHKGHQKMVELAVNSLSDVDGDKVLIYVVKGNASSLDNEQNPLSEQEQIELISSIYKDNPQVEVAQDVIPNAHLAASIIPSLYDKGLKLVGLAAGPDRLPQYKQFVYAFSPSYFKADHKFTPIDKTESGHYNFKFVETPRIFSGTEARNLAKTATFDNFLNSVVGSNVSEETRNIYHMVYDKLRGEESQEETERSLEEARYNLGIFCGLIKEHITYSGKAKYNRQSGEQSKLQQAKHKFNIPSFTNKVLSDFLKSYSHPRAVNAKPWIANVGEERYYETVLPKINKILKNVSFEYTFDKNGFKGMYIPWYPHTNRIVLELANIESLNDLKSVIIHELTHVLDDELKMPRIGKIKQAMARGPLFSKKFIKKHGIVMPKIASNLSGAQVKNIYSLLDFNKLKKYLNDAPDNDSIWKKITKIADKAENRAFGSSQYLLRPMEIYAELIALRTQMADRLQPREITVNDIKKLCMQSQGYQFGTDIERYLNCSGSNPQRILKMFYLITRDIAKNKTQQTRSQMAESNNDGTAFGVGRAHFGQNLAGNHKVAPDDPNRDNVHNEPEETFSLDDLGLEIKNMIADKLKEQESLATIKANRKQEDLEEISGVGAVEGGGGPFGIRRRKRKPAKKPIEETTIKLVNYLLKISGEQ
jgi:hypothetical protein